MAEQTKTKVLDINTGKAQKNVKSLKQVIKELRDEMALLEQGTAEYDAMSKKLADAMQKQREIAEAAKYSNKDIGATLGNIATVGAGAVGAINGVSAALQLVGVSGEDAEQALKNIQLTMAIIQGMTALDSAGKALKGLTVAFKGLNTERVRNSGLVKESAGSTEMEAGALLDNTKKMADNNEEAEEYNKKQIQQKRLTDQSANAIDIETNRIQAKTAAEKGEVGTLKELEAEYVSLKAKQEALAKAGVDTATSKVAGMYQKQIDKLKTLQNFETSMGLKGHSMDFDKLIANYENALKALKTGTTDTTEILKTTWKSLSAEMQQNLAKGLPVDEIEKQMKDVAAAMSSKEIKNEIKSLSEEGSEAVEKLTKHLEANGVSTEQQKVILDGYTASMEREKQILYEQFEINEFLKRSEQDLTRERGKNITTTNGETASLKENTKEKMKNAGATKGLAGAEADAGKSAKSTVPLIGGITKGIKGIGKAIGGLIKSAWPIAALAAIIWGISKAVEAWTKHNQELNKERMITNELNAQAKNSYEEEIVRLRTLIKTAADEREGLDERKKAVEELNKLVPNYNAQLDETTGKYTANRDALKEYCDKLYQKIQLEAYEGKIKEYLQEQLELQQKINKIQNSGWNLFGIRIANAKAKIKDLDKDIQFMFDKIKELDLSKALDDNKVDTGNKTVKSIVKTFKEVFAQLKTMYENLWNTIFDEKELRLTFNGVYSETDIMLSKIRRIIKSKNLGKYLSDDFKKALKDGLPDDMNYQITLDWVFDKKQSQDFYNELAKENNKLVDLMNSRKPVSEETLKKQQEVIDKLKEEEANRKLVMEATQKYFEQRRKEANETEKLVEAKEQYLKQLEIERTFKYEQRSGNTYADINKEIAANELLVKQIEDRMAVRQGELNWLKSLPDQNKQVTERIKELNKEQIDDEKAKNTALANIDEQNYQTRLKYVEEYYEKAKEQADASTAELENNRTLDGWGVVDYNTQLDILKLSLKAIKDTMEETAAYYDMQIALAGDNAEKRIELEAEKLEALRRLNADYAAQEIEIEKAKIDRKIAIQQTYTSVMENITGEIQSLLQTQMANYDQNSKQYKKLAVANGIIDVTKGTLSAFMSGIESGVPAPWNLVVAGVMSALVFATGMAQLNNIKNATAANATSGSSNVSFGSYDTMTYAQNSDILSSIADQRVYVLESDITSTQNRVQVTESNATF